MWGRMEKPSGATAVDFSQKILHDFKDEIIFTRLFLVGVVCNVAVFIFNLAFCGLFLNCVS